jgi:Fe-S cluster assembly protein SufD
MSQFQQHALALAKNLSPVDWLDEFRAQAAMQWEKTLWPTKKTEAWMYTPLLNLQKNTNFIWANELATQAIPELIEIDAIRLVFVNGVFDAKASSELPAEVVRFSQASASQQNLIKQHLGSVIEGDKHLFSGLNNAWLDEGVLIHLQSGQQLNKPVYIVQVSQGDHLAHAINHRLLIVLEKNSRAEIIEHFVSSANQQSHFVNAVTEAVLQEGAHLHHYNLHLETEQQQHIGAVHVNLGRNSRLRAFTLALGSQLMRIDYQCHHRGEGAELDLQGIYLPRNQQLVDYHTNIQHWVPHCTSNEIFRGIISDEANAVFNGRIHIHPKAQKTLAELSNKNLLTSNKAQINTKPELEIYADDVKCAHGATVSQLNQHALYYLQSRGISQADAQVMMSFGFINELLQAIEQESVRHYLSPKLAKLFGRDSVFDEVES